MQEEVEVEFYHVLERFSPEDLTANQLAGVVDIIIYDDEKDEEKLKIKKILEEACR